MASAQERDPSNVAREKRAVAKEDLVFLTSGAKEKMDKTLVGMKGAGHILTHPFSKEAREEANSRTIEEKNKVGAKQADIRAIAHQQKEFEVAAALAADIGRAEEPEKRGSPTPALPTDSSIPGNRQLPSTFDKSPDGSESSSSGSDGSSKTRAQIPPTSSEYRSG